MAEENKTVYIVFAKLEYGHAGPEEGTGGAGETSAIVGIASNNKIAHQLVSIDHLETLADEGLSPLKYPLDINEIGDATVTIKGGSILEGTWTNTVTWTVQEIPLDTLIEDFEL